MPTQKPTPNGSDPRATVLNFSDPTAIEYIVRDISPTPGTERWTFDHPEMWLPVEPHPGLRFEMRFHIHPNTFRDTGPVTVTVKINGHLLGSIHCDHVGSYQFDQPVPEEWVHAGEPTHILAEASPLWTAPEDRTHLGYLIDEAGFRW